MIFIQASSVEAKKPVKKSAYTKYGLRLYRGNLPPDAEFKFVSVVEGAASKAGIAGYPTAATTMLAKAKALGGNAVINFQLEPHLFIPKYSGDAVIMKKYLREFSEDDFVKFKGSKEQEKTDTIEYSAEKVIGVAKDYFSQHFYELSSEENSGGKVVTEPMETISKPNWPDKGLYPVVVWEVTVSDAGEGSSEITVKGIFVKGTVRSKSFAKNFTESELCAISSEFIDVLSESRKGKELDIQLEKMILSL